MKERKEMKERRQQVTTHLIQVNFSVNRGMREERVRGRRATESMSVPIHSIFLDVYMSV